MCSSNNNNNTLLLLYFVRGGAPIYRWQMVMGFMNRDHAMYIWQIGNLINKSMRFLKVLLADYILSTHTLITSHEENTEKLGAVRDLII